MLPNLPTNFKEPRYTWKVTTKSLLFLLLSWLLHVVVVVVIVIINLDSFGFPSFYFQNQVTHPSCHGKSEKFKQLQEKWEQEAKDMTEDHYATLRQGQLAPGNSSTTVALGEGGVQQNGQVLYPNKFVSLQVLKEAVKN